MRRLIVCADGTWNQPNEDDHGVPAPTNVVKMQQAIKSVDARGVSQIVFYHKGVGTGTDVLDKVAGGAFGEGLDTNIKDCYRFLVNNYTPGDEIYFFGFSRGAYTVRSLAGLIRNSGMLQQAHAGMIDEAFSLYRDRDPSKDPTSNSATAFRQAFSRDVDLQCVGVWDTVGALGVPTYGLTDVSKVDIFEFADRVLSDKVKAGFHALAIDEQRVDFEPTLWEDRQGIEQRWFCGAHADVGGGYAKRDLATCSLDWMIGRLRGAGVAISAQYRATDAFDFGPIHTPYREPPFDVRPHSPRQIPKDARFHPSVQLYLTQFAAYEPSSNLAPWLRGRQLAAAVLAA